ncbi:Trm112 family protein [Candidatus Margulisiibacteriota bacterium]
MDKNILNSLCCPACKKGLVCADLKEHESDTITAGSLLCDNCRSSYEITEGIPVLLPGKSSEI